MDYEKTLNLPRTTFPMKANLPSLEPKIRQKWDKLNIYEKITQSRKQAAKWVLHDGPPYANGNVHIGTALNKILKDMVIKYKTMRGFYAPYVPGWDCHGLPIEHETQQQLGDRIKEMTPVQIRDACRKWAEKFIQIQKEQFKALGVFGNWDKPYLTMDPTYEVAIYEILEKLVEKELIYRRNKPIHWCTNCKTALAGAEVEYKEKTSDSIYLRFQITSDKKADFKLPKDKTVDLLVWTTTPWTLPGNQATVVHPYYDYALCEYEMQKIKSFGIICKDLVEPLKNILGIKKVISSCRGRELVGLEYKHPLLNQHCPVLPADYVSLTEGTGLVHTAPGHGEVDYLTGVENDLKVFSPVDNAGRFTGEVKGYEGLHVFEANSLICNELLERGILLAQSEIHHSYPHCWRCKKPVIFRATEQWFISIDKDQTRTQALTSVQRVRWIPKWGQIRITNMIEERPDWCISRQRVWGVPIPAFSCKRCEHVLFDLATITAVKNRIKELGSDCWFKLRVDEFLPKGSKCSKCSSTDFEKRNEIVDVWFESAASHRAVCMRNPELAFPVDLYLEGTDQHRGWFQVSLLSSLLSNGQSPFKTVLTHGFIIDAQTGTKFSKSGLAISVDEVISKLGSDILRLWVSSINYTDDMPITWEILCETAEPYRKIRNTFRFMLSNLYDFDPSKDAVGYDTLLTVDRWALLGLNKLIKDVTSYNEQFEIYKGYHRLYEFCTTTLSATYFYILKDRLYTFAKNSTERRSAQTALYQILVSLVKLFAPILTYTTEEIWEYIPDTKEAASIHLTYWPRCEDRVIDPDLEKKWKILFSIRDEVNRQLEKLRKEGKIGNSLEAICSLHSVDKDLQAVLREHEKELASIFVVSEVFLTNSPPEGAIEAQDIRGLFSRVDRSPYKKCVRCWNYSNTVGSSQEQPQICARCIQVLSKDAIR